MASKSLVITISREHGSGGRQIAQEVARRLKLPYVDSQIIKSATQQLGLEKEELGDFDENVQPHLEEISRLVSQRQVGESRIALSEVLVPEKDAFGLPRRASGPAARTLADPELERRANILSGFHRLVEATIREVAGRGGAVILGRGSQFILKNRPHTAHIHVFAPREVRIERLMNLAHLSREQAEDALRDSDEKRSGYIRYFYRADWRDPSHYHLILNTGALSLEAAVATVLELGHKIHIQSSQTAQAINSTYDRLEQDSYTLKEAADLLWVSPEVLKQAAYRGQLKVSLVDHQVHRISRSALVEWLHRRDS